MPPTPFQQANRCTLHITIGALLEKPDPELGTQSLPRTEVALSCFWKPQTTKCLCGIPSESQVEPTWGTAQAISQQNPREAHMSPFGWTTDWIVSFSLPWLPWPNIHLLWWIQETWRSGKAMTFYSHSSKAVLKDSEKWGPVGREEQPVSSAWSSVSELMAEVASVHRVC